MIQAEAYKNAGKYSRTVFEHKEKHRFHFMLDGSKEFLPLEEYNIPFLNLKSKTKILLSPEASNFIQTKMKAIEKMAYSKSRQVFLDSFVDIEGKNNILSRSDQAKGMWFFSEFIFRCFLLFCIDWIFRMISNMYI